MRKQTIIAIVGPSGSGKTVAANCIQHCLGIPSVVSCTTRQIRPEEKDGKEHWFVGVEAMPDRSDMLAYTLFGGHHYWVDKHRIPAEDIFTYVIDEDGLIGLIENWKDSFDIVPVFIKRAYDTLVETVGRERVERDKQRTQLPEDTYDYIIDNNNLTIRQFCEKVREMAVDIKNKYYGSTHNK